MTMTFTTVSNISLDNMEDLGMVVMIEKECPFIFISFVLITRILTNHITNLNNLSHVIS
jgi:hypothetical protein